MSSDFTPSDQWPEGSEFDWSYNGKRYQRHGDAEPAFFQVAIPKPWGVAFTGESASVEHAEASALAQYQEFEQCDHTFYRLDESGLARCTTCRNFTEHGLTDERHCARCGSQPAIYTIPGDDESHVKHACEPCYYTWHLPGELDGAELKAPNNNDPESHRVINYWTFILRKRIAYHLYRKLVIGEDASVSWALVNGSTPQYREGEIEALSHEVETLIEENSDTSRQTLSETYGDTALNSLSCAASLQAMSEEIVVLNAINVIFRLKELQQIRLRPMDPIDDETFVQMKVQSAQALFQEYLKRINTDL